MFGSVTTSLLSMLLPSPIICTNPISLHHSNTFHKSSSSENLHAMTADICSQFTLRNNTLLF
jgi:hypothetical protein